MAVVLVEGFSADIVKLIPVLTLDIASDCRSLNPHWVIMVIVQKLMVYFTRIFLQFVVDFPRAYHHFI